MFYQSVCKRSSSKDYLKKNRNRSGSIIDKEIFAVALLNGLIEMNAVYCVTPVIFRRAAFTK